MEQCMKCKKEVSLEGTCGTYLTIHRAKPELERPEEYLNKQYGKYKEKEYNICWECVLDVLFRIEEKGNKKEVLMMSELNEKELKKLAEWAGFKWGTNGSGWWTPDNDFYSCGIKDLPPFEHLDTCFAWLVPKLSMWSIEKDSTYGEAWCRATITVGKPFNHQVAHAETPALALCKAILELIKDVENEA